MSATEYIASFFLVIIGFAISELLKGSATILRERKKITFYWPWFLAIPFVFEVLIFWFLWIFTMINNGPVEAWTVARLLWLSLMVVPLAFISYLMFPSEIEKGFQLKDFYMENGKFLVGLALFLNVYTIIELIRTDAGGLFGVSATLVLNFLVLLNFRKLHIAWLVLNILLVNYFIFFEQPLVIK